MNSKWLPVFYAVVIIAATVVVIHAFSIFIPHALRFSQEEQEIAGSDWGAFSVGITRAMQVIIDRQPQPPEGV